MKSLFKQLSLEGGDKRTKMLRNKHLKVTTLFCPPFSYWNGMCTYDTRNYSNNSCQGKPDGIDQNILSLLSENLGFTYSLLNVSSSHENYGAYEAILMAAADGTADLASCGLWLSDYDGKTETLDAINLWDQLCITFMVPEPHMIISWRNILRPFSSSAWLFILTVAIGFSVIAFIIFRFQITRIRKQGVKNRDALSSFILGMIGVTLGIPVPRTHAKSTTAPLRILAMTWSFSCMILISFYTMNLSSFLTVPYFQPKMNSLDDLVKNNFTWGMQVIPKMSEILNLHTESGKLFAQKFQLVGNLEEKLKSGKFALPVIRMDDFYFIISPKMAQLRNFKGMRVMKERQSCYYPAIFVPKNSPLTDPFNIKILRLIEVGILRKIRGEVFGRHKESIQDVADKIYQASMEKAWGMKNLLGPFTVLAFGWVLSALLFIFEKLTYNYWTFTF